MLAAAAFGFIAAASTASAQSQRLFLTDYNFSSNPFGSTRIYQNGAEISSYQWTTASQMIIGVTGNEIRQAHYYGDNQIGSVVYDETGVVVGTGSALASGTRAYDGTTDGQRIYLVEYPVGTVVSYDLSFNDRTELFTANNSDLGITFDSGTGTIWTSNWANGNVSQYDLSGNLLGQFNAGLRSVAALAYESSTETLWLFDNYENTLEQYDRSGNLLSSTFSTDQYGFLGGEFSSVGNCAAHIERIEELEDQLLQILDLLDSTEQQLANVTAERDHQQGTIAEQTAEIASLAAQRDQLNAQIDGLNQQVASLTSQLSTANAQIASLENTNSPQPTHRLHHSRTPMLLRQHRLHHSRTPTLLRQHRLHHSRTPMLIKQHRLLLLRARSALSKTSFLLQTTSSLRPSQNLIHARYSY